MYCLSKKVYVKELKIKLIFLIFKHAVQRSRSVPCSLKKCTLPYIYFAFICLILSFGINKERLDKKFEYFFIGSERP